MTTDLDPRAGYIAGLRKLADALERDETLPLPYFGASPHVARLSVFVKTKTEVVAYARLMGKAEKKVDNDSPHFGFELEGAVDGLHLVVVAPRSEICERVVTGTETVTREVPDPEALAAVPTTTVTETVEKVEWICSPLLAGSVTA